MASLTNELVGILLFKMAVRGNGLIPVNVQAFSPATLYEIGMLAINVPNSYIIPNAHEICQLAINVPTSYIIPDGREICELAVNIDKKNIP